MRSEAHLTPEESNSCFFVSSRYSRLIKTIDITNEGKIKIAGKGIGIYADNNVNPAYPHHSFNDHVTKENAVVNNKASLNLGDESIGILTKKATIRPRATSSC